MIIPLLGPKHSHAFPKAVQERPFLPEQPVYSALRPPNVRPAMVEPPNHYRARPLSMRFLGATVLPFVKRFVPAYISPTGPLASVLVDLATGNGEPKDVRCVTLQCEGLQVGDDDRRLTLTLMVLINQLLIPSLLSSVIILMHARAATV